MEGNEIICKSYIIICILNNPFFVNLSDLNHQSMQWKHSKLLQGLKGKKGNTREAKT